MITLNNGATVHAAFILPPSEGMKAHGVVLAEQSTDWVVWDISLDPEYNDATGHVGWECENGHYFQKESKNMNAKIMAYFQFGLSVRRTADYDITRGLQTDVSR